MLLEGMVFHLALDMFFTDGPLPSIAVLLPDH